MKSKKRKVLIDYLGERKKFVATVQNIRRDKNKLTLMDISIEIYGELQRVSYHMHITNVSKKYINNVKLYDVVYFTGIPYRYNKTDFYGNKIFNYSIRDIRDMKPLEVIFNE